jgi:hypothetical protein
MNFFLHEMAIFAPVRRIPTLAAVKYWPFNRFAFSICNRATAFSQVRYIAIFENLVLARDWQQGSDIRSNKKPRFGNSDEKRRALAGDD